MACLRTDSTIRPFLKKQMRSSRQGVSHVVKTAVLMVQRDLVKKEKERPMAGFGM